MNDRHRDADTPVRFFNQAGGGGKECPLHDRRVPFRSIDSRADISIRRRNLPHWQQPGACYFITFRLGDALPQHLLAQWCGERAIWLRWNPEPWSDKQRDEYHERFTECQECWLDAGSGACHLRRSEVRALVLASAMKFDSVRYDVDALVLMPNHVHLILQMRADFNLTKELKALKGASARACNQLLGLSEAFWMEESYDRIVRDAEELAAFRVYIADNPAKAGLKASEFTFELFTRLEVQR